MESECIAKSINSNMKMKMKRKKQQETTEKSNKDRIDFCVELNFVISFGFVFTSFLENAAAFAWKVSYKCFIFLHLMRMSSDHIQKRINATAWNIYFFSPFTSPFSPFFFFCSPSWLFSIASAINALYALYTFCHFSVPIFCVYTLE